MTRVELLFYEVTVKEASIHESLVISEYQNLQKIELPIQQAIVEHGYLGL